MDTLVQHIDDLWEIIFREPFTIYIPFSNTEYINLHMRGVLSSRVSFFGGVGG